MQKLAWTYKFFFIYKDLSFISRLSRFEIPVTRLFTSFSITQWILIRKMLWFIFWRILWFTGFKFIIRFVRFSKRLFWFIQIVVHFFWWLFIWFRSSRWWWMCFLIGRISIDIGRIKTFFINYIFLVLIYKCIQMIRLGHVRNTKNIVHIWDILFIWISLKLSFKFRKIILNNIPNYLLNSLIFFRLLLLKESNK